MPQLPRLPVASTRGGAAAAPAGVAQADSREGLNLYPHGTPSPGTSAGPGAAGGASCRSRPISPEAFSGLAGTCPAWAANNPCGALFSLRRCAASAALAASLKEGLLKRPRALVGNTRGAGSQRRRRYGADCRRPPGAHTAGLCDLECSGGISEAELLGKPRRTLDLQGRREHEAFWQFFGPSLLSPVQPRSHFRLHRSGGPFVRSWVFLVADQTPRAHQAGTMSSLLLRSLQGLAARGSLARVPLRSAGGAWVGGHRIAPLAVRDAVAAGCPADPPSGLG